MQHAEDPQTQCVMINGLLHSTPAISIPLDPCAIGLPTLNVELSATQSSTSTNVVKMLIAPNVLMATVHWAFNVSMMDHASALMTLTVPTLMVSAMFPLLMIQPHVLTVTVENVKEVKMEVTRV